MTTDLQARLAAGLLAENSTIATYRVGTCSICRHTIVTGERHASLVPDGKLAHVSCIAATATPRTRVPRIW
jgi:hypothetical protein